MEEGQEAGDVEAIVSDSDDLQSPVRSEDVGDPEASVRSEDAGEPEASEVGDGALVVQETQTQVLSLNPKPWTMPSLPFCGGLFPSHTWFRDWVIE